MAASCSTGLSDFFATKQNCSTGCQNVSETERVVSVGTGALLVLTGLMRGAGARGLLMMAVGGGLIYRGMTGHCSLYEAMEVSTNPDHGKRHAYLF